MSANITFLPVNQAYDRWASFYDAYSNSMVYTATHIMATRFGELQGADVFEFGCGTGRNLAAMKSSGAGVVAGCDLSDGMLAVAQKRDAAFQLFQHDMSQTLPDGLQKFDHVLFCLTLEHMKDLLQPLQSAKQLLKENGTIIIIEIHPTTLGVVSAHFKDGDDEVHMPTFAHQFADYLNAIAAAGLRVTSCTEWRARDLGDHTPPKVFKRGPDFLLAVEFSVQI